MRATTNGGASLLELLIAMALTATLASVMLSLVMAAQKSRGSSQRARTSSNARALLRTFLPPNSGAPEPVSIAVRVPARWRATFRRLPRPLMVV